jgi:hypothetical protein
MTPAVDFAATGDILEIDTREHFIEVTPLLQSGHSGGVANGRNTDLADAGR